MKYSKSRYKKIYSKTKVPFDCEVAWLGENSVNHLVENYSGVNEVYGGIKAICGKEWFGYWDSNNRPECKSCLAVLKKTKYLNYIIKK